MSFIDHTSAGAFVKAVQIASESDRRHAQRYGQPVVHKDASKRGASSFRRIFS